MSVFSELIKKCDESFSKYIRQKYAGPSGRVACYTCGNTFHWKQIDCGHFIRRDCMCARYHDDNARPQCIECNRMKDGNIGMFEVKLKYELGVERFKELESLRHQLAKFARYELEEMIVKYNSLLKWKT